MFEETREASPKEEFVFGGSIKKRIERIRNKQKRVYACEIYTYFLERKTLLFLLKEIKT